MSKLKLVVEHEIEVDDDDSMLEVVDYLNDVATQVKDGFSFGVGWKLTDPDVEDE